ncbi:3,4-dihydroxy-2-butanone-4-phosphate synthase [Ectobacillus funiculus]|uniref:3,4-dihydroxy-2-butanone-4-phosphate synthase n=1 Tax=Ectobacillus funiculus TaxID=137993 RepID=UPI0039780043
MIASVIERGIGRMKDGELIILLDDINTGTGTLVGAAQHVTPNLVNFMTKIGKGLISVCLTEENAKKLDLLFMVDCSLNPKTKPFTVSVDHRTNTTGISAYERADTIRAFTYEDVQPEDFRKPGHIFPLAGKENGLLQRVDIVEAVIDLTKMASLVPVGYICDILNQKGEMASELEIETMSDEYGLPILKMSEMMEVRRNDVLCTFTGKVISGNQIGRQIGFPTANLRINEDEVQLSNGVYGVKAIYNERLFTGIMNVGIRPTISEEAMVHYEVHIFDFDEMIYDEVLQIEACFFVREEISFFNLDQLILQIKNDVELVKSRLHAGEKAKETALLIGGIV